MPNPEFRKIVLIGLGGSGQLILTHLKRLFVDTYGVVPPSVRMLSLDTDFQRVSLRSQVGEAEYTLDAQEFLYMRVDDPINFIRGSAAVGDWYVKPLPVGAITAGAGAVRQNGRLAFFAYINEFLRRLDRIVTDLNSDELPARMAHARAEMGAKTDFVLSERDPEVYICGSLAGGTGSGTFLDVAILLRDQIPNALIHGFFLLNWVYRNKAFAYRVKGNVYAALAELDNLQSIMFGSRGFAPYRMTYGDRPVVVDKAPYDLFHLIDGRKENRENIDDVDQLCDTVATAVFLSVGCLGGRVSSVVDNLLAHVNSEPPAIWKGRHARYSSLGVSSLFYPAREIHRLAAAEQALKLCSAAIEDVKKELSDEGRQSQYSQAIDQDVTAFLNELALSRINIHDGVCPYRDVILFQPANHEIADPQFPALISDHLSGAEQELDQNLESARQGDGQIFVENVREGIRRKVEAIKANASLDSAYLLRWINAAAQRFSGWMEEASEALKQAKERESGLRENAGNLLTVAGKSRHIPFLGGPRKSAAAAWAQAAVELLDAIRDRKVLEHETALYKAVLEQLKDLAPSGAPTESQVTGALLETERQLRAVLLTEQRNFKVLRESKRTQIIVGNGTTIIVPSELGKKLPRVESPAGESTMDRASLDLPYSRFREDRKIGKAEDYLTHAAGGRSKLASLFLDYASEELKGLADVGVLEAMDVIGRAEGDEAAYYRRQIHQLFRLASALWSFSRGRMNEIQRPHYDKIVNIGVDDLEAGRAVLDGFVRDAKADYAIAADHSYSPTGDKYRIWLLNYAAALPVYYLSGLEDSKLRYEEEMTPTYHVDRYFEMKVPDLFPVADLDNRALRVLGMAIVPGVDVIMDEKLPKGHRFTLYADEVRHANFGQPKVWLLFREMYREVLESATNGGGPNLLEILVALLKRRIAEVPQDQLRNAIDQYITRVRQRLENRDFSRLISARLTFREISELEKFIRPDGYAMDIDRYIGGN